MDSTEKKIYPLPGPEVSSRYECTVLYDNCENVNLNL